MEPAVARATETSSTPKQNIWERLLCPGVLLRIAFVLTFLAYLRTVTYDFVFDDHLQVAMNPWIVSWGGLKYIFTMQSWAFVDFETPARFYRPLYLAWLWAVRMVSDGAPGWFHLAELLSHLGVTWLAYLLARRLLRNDRAAAIAALLFALHPTKIESVAWVAGATEVVHAAFFFGLFVAYFRWREEPKLRWMAVSVACFGAAVLAKETALLAPALLLAYEWMAAERGSRQRSVAHLLRLAVPFAVVGVVYWVARMKVLGTMADLSGDLSLTKTFYTVPLAFCWYLKQLAWPFHLSLFYPEMIVRNPEAMRFFGASVVLLLVAATLGWAARRSSEMKFLGLWLLATLVPVVGGILVLQPHDRYLYLPSFAFAVMLAALISKLNHKAAVIAVVALALSYATATFIDEKIWEDDRHLFTRAVEVAPDLPHVWELLAGTYSGMGDIPSGLKILEEGDRRIPNSIPITYSLAVTYYNIPDYDRASEYFRRAIALNPGRRIEGLSCYQLGMIAHVQGRDAEAEPLLRRAIQLTPKAAGFHRALANVLTAEGKSAEASEHMELDRQSRISRSND